MGQVVNHANCDNKYREWGGTDRGVIFPHTLYQEDRARTKWRDLIFLPLFLAVWTARPHRQCETETKP